VGERNGWRALFAVLVGLAGVVVTGSLPVGAATSPKWMINSSAIGLINGYTGNGTLTTNAFDVATTIEVGTPAAKWVSQSTATFTFYGPVSKKSSFLYAVKHHLVPKGTVYVLLDMESWSLTPHSEQVTPKVYLREFVSAAHKDGYEAIVAPSLDLTTGMSCSKSADPSWKNYLEDCSVPTIVANADPDVYDVQSQSFEANTSANSDCECFAWFVDQAASQAHADVPALDVRGGLSTNPSGQVSSGQTLYTDTINTDSAVDGYWLNVPQKSGACPSCVASGAPRVAVAYLEQLGYTS
jgi:hypothetical protein